MTRDRVAASYAHCRRVTRRAKSSFPLAFRLLPRPKRDGMTALYAFLRLTDDLADEPGEPAAKRAALDRWRTHLDDAARGVFAHRVHAALHDTVTRYAVPTAHLHAVIDGVAQDLEPRPFATFADLYPYCYRVASAVGLACVPIWGVRAGADPAHVAAASEAAGIAFQLTNILRDFGEDLTAGRVYLPAEDFDRFRLTPTACREPARRAEFLALMAFEAARARAFYAASTPLAGLLTPEGRRIFTGLSNLYRTLLARVERRAGDVLTERVRLPRATKAAVLVRAWWDRGA